MVKELVHKAIVNNRSAVNEWFCSHTRGFKFPFYASFDLRESKFKVAPVDANIFPAGFNNICQTDKDSSVEHVREFLHQHYPDVKGLIGLVAEEHTSNAFYWENVLTLKNLIEGAGYRVEISIPRLLPQPLQVESVNGHKMTIHSAQRVDNRVLINGEEAELLISNNDFTEEYVDWMQGLDVRMNPPHALGWHRRRKQDFFNHYNQLASSFCEVIDVDPWLLTVQTERFPAFDINSEESRLKLANQVDHMIDSLRRDYAAHSEDEEPFVFIKNSAGTYGLGVLQAQSGEDVKSWSYKSRKKMKAVKGGGNITEVIIQEGIASDMIDEGVTSEPAIYMIGQKLAGGFLRTHEKKGPRESLNSPGAVYKRLCVSDLEISIEGHPLENVFGWVAKIGMLAISKEIEAANISLKGYVG